MQQWLSIHLPCSRDIYGTDVDGQVAAVANALALSTMATAHWFFVRYFDETGPHVRYRFCMVEQETSRRDIEQLLLQVGRVRASVAPNAAAPQPSWVAYEPEVVRYGGVAALEFAERHFVASTRFACIYLERPERTRANVIGQGLLAMLVIAYALQKGRKAFFQRYFEGCLGGRALSERAAQLRSRFEASFPEQRGRIEEIVGATTDCLIANQSMSDALDSYRTSCEQYRLGLTELLGGVQAEKVCDWTAASLLHMTSNRIGLTVADEAFCAFMLSEVGADVRLRDA